MKKSLGPKTLVYPTPVFLVGTYGAQLHTQFVGEVVDVKVDEAALASDGMADIQKVRPLVFTPDTQAYCGIGSFIAKAFSVGESI
jgi:flavin reductase (DIM6/NTAB) family NADH-FMN oxidoreductase RutF